MSYRVFSGSASGGGPTYHGSNRISSEYEVDLKSVAEVGGINKTDTLVRVHAVFMLIAWLASASCGILLAR